jgi:undecaprenyl-diphosphatase
MNILSSVILGIIQGLTEFLPVSSSGHLVLAQSLIPGFSQPGVLFDITLHMGTLLAVLFYFRKKIFSLSKNYLIFLLIGTVPAVLAGVLFGDYLESLFSSARATAFQLMATGVLNIVVDFLPKGAGQLTSKNSFLMGIAQAVAIIPGISRSGATIFTGVLAKVEKVKVAEFSFLLSVPAIAGAMLYQLTKYGVDSVENPSYYLVGFLISLIVGFLSISVVFKFLLGRLFKVFGIYAIALGIVFLLLK